MSLLDRSLSIVARARELLGHVEYWLMCKKYPLMEVSSEIDKAFVKAYEQPIRDIFEREGRLRPRMVRTSARARPWQ